MPGLAAASSWWHALLLGSATPKAVASMAAGESGSLPRVELNTITYNALLHCLEFFYAGMAEICTRHPLLLVSPVAQARRYGTLFTRPQGGASVLKHEPTH